MVVYAPGTLEKDPKNQNMALQAHAGAIESLQTAVAALPTATATQADMETGTSTTAAVVPGVQKYHPAHPKAWCYVTQSAGVYTLRASYGVSAATKAATGRVDITLSTAFSSVNYAVTGSCNDNPNLTFNEITGSRSTTNFRAMLRNANTSTDTDCNFTAVFFGDQ